MNINTNNITKMLISGYYSHKDMLCGSLLFFCIVDEYDLKC